MVGKVVPAENLDSVALDLAKKLAKGAPLAIGLSKSEDAGEGIRARTQKRACL
jgi:enoyl-CoA hydratase/carnithine racemase